MTSNKRPIENLRRVFKLLRLLRETMGCPKCTTRLWRTASKSLMTSCCVSGSFLHLSLSSESTRDSTVASRESKSCRSGLQSFTQLRTVASYIGMSCQATPRQSNQTPSQDHTQQYKTEVPRFPIVLRASREDMDIFGQPKSSLKQNLKKSSF